MNRHVSAIAASLTLRLPQRDSPEILDRMTEIVPFTVSPAVAAPAATGSKFAKVTDFEWEFRPVCFALVADAGPPGGDGCECAHRFTFTVPREIVTFRP